MTNQDIILDGLGLGSIAALPKKSSTRKKVVRGMRVKSGIVSTSDTTGKGEFEMRRNLDLPPAINAGLNSGALQLVDAVLYGTRIAGSETVLDILQDGDVKVVGLSNLNARKLETNRWFLLTAIRVQSGVNANILLTDFGIPVANVLNGEFELKNGATVLIPRSSSRIFDTNGRGDLHDGESKVTPQWLAPGTDIKFELRTPVAAAANTNYRVELIGVAVEKN